MLDLLDDAGKLRTVDVGSGLVRFVPFAKVPERLETLLAVLASRLEESSTFEKRLKLSCFFMREFLNIHPFRNGNGRVARILFSKLVREFTIVPASLYTRLTFTRGHLPGTPFLANLKLCHRHVDTPAAWAFAHRLCSCLYPERQLYIDSLRAPSHVEFTRYAIECLRSSLTEMDDLLD